MSRPEMSGAERETEAERETISFSVMARTKGDNFRNWKLRRRERETFNLYRRRRRRRIKLQFQFHYLSFISLAVVRFVCPDVQRSNPSINRTSDSCHLWDVRISRYKNWSMSCKLITQDPKDPTDYSVSYKLSLVLEIELIAETKPGTKP